MELALLIYCVQVVFPTVSKLFGIACGGLSVFMIFSSLCHLIHKNTYAYDESGDIALWVKKKRYWVGIFVLGFMANILPDKETSYAMIAAYGVQSLAENEKVQEFAGNSFKVLDKYMQEYLEEEVTTENIETKVEEK